MKQKKQPKKTTGKNSGIKTLKRVWKETKAGKQKDDNKRI